MGKWSCVCGCGMNDHYFPDENHYSVYSDMLFNEIANTADDDNKISYEDMSDASFHMWKCPKCHGLMAFENEDSHSYNFYKRIMSDTKYLGNVNFSKPNTIDSKIRIAVVTFFEVEEKEYFYSCEDESILINHYVEVPYGINNFIEIGQVKRITKILVEELPFSIDKLKPVLKKYSYFDEEKTREIFNELERTGACLDFTAEDKKEIDKEVCDFIKTPLGHFWLELNGVPVAMEVKKENNTSELRVNYSLRICLAKTIFRSIDSLKLCADFDIDAARWIRKISGNYIWGNSWEKDGIHFGITAQEDLFGIQNEVKTDIYSTIPYYHNWYGMSGQQPMFKFSWKKYELDEDESIEFAIV